MDDREDFYYTPTVKEDTMMMVSFYNVTHSHQMSNILYMYTNIPGVLWFGCSISFLIYVLIVMMGQKMLKSKPTLDPIWSTFEAFIDQDDYSFSISNRRYPRFLIALSLTISISIFYISNLMNNSVGTDMVTIDKAYAPESYQEVLDHNIRAVFNKMLPEYEKFRDSPLGSNERKLYENALYFAIEPQSIVSLRSPILNQQVTLVGRRMMAEAAGLGLLTMIGTENPDARILMTSDANAKRYTNVFAIRRHVDGKMKKMTSKT